ncbi:MAG: hypothetical protein U0031_07100 [Thermomicrobiales bacterium]
MTFGVLVTALALAMLGGMTVRTGPVNARQESELPVDKILVGGVPLTVEIAADPASRARGWVSGMGWRLALACSSSSIGRNPSRSG